MSGADNVTTRVIPTCGVRESLRHGGTYLELRNLPAVVYAETDLMTVVYDDAKLVERWVHKRRQLEELALSPAESIEALLDCADAYDHCPPSQSHWDPPTWQLSRRRAPSGCTS
jgi:hypothetical protein